MLDHAQLLQDFEDYGNVHTSPLRPRGISMEAIADGAAAAESVAEEKEFWIPEALPSRKRERERFGPATDQSKCFFCGFVGEKNTVVPREDVNSIVQFLREYFGNMDDAELADQVVERYTVLRSRVNRDLRPGERPLPPMDEATVLAHIRGHTNDPEVKLRVIQSELREARQTILKRGLFERSSRTGKKRMSKMQMDNLDKIIKLELFVAKQDPSKMLDYSAGARVEPSTHGQGPVSASTKTLFSYWRNN